MSACDCPCHHDGLYICYECCAGPAPTGPITIEEANRRFRELLEQAAEACLTWDADYIQFIDNGGKNPLS